MPPTRSESNYSIQQNGSGPVQQSHKSKRPECQPRAEAQMEDSIASTGSQRLESTFDTLLESQEAEITAIPVVRPESSPTGNSGDLPVSVNELVYGGKGEGVGTFSKSLNRNLELISSSKGAVGPREDGGPSAGFENHVLQRKNQKDKGLVEKPKHSVRGPKERVGPKEGQQTSGSSSSLHKKDSSSKKCQTRARNPQREIRRESKRQSPSGTNLTHRTKEFQRKKRQPWKMCSIWQEI
ncbi:hypothetical protein O181_055291 [Austropuccinia psidii MF-1]|uniref:Uncharacterized protein n=1 Tax=Austropuccinia psidii MF-1 TaxID=1389203 RepID=A0A9Q3HRX4_9BASI|nr:hypothetical protein [Austropuccinia psidii MF-1]